MWWATRHHLTGLPDGLTWWPGAPNADHAGAWLTRQAARRQLLQPGQQQLIDELLPAGTAAAGTNRDAGRADADACAEPPGSPQPSYGSGCA